MRFSLVIFFFFFNDTATTEIYTLSLHDALPIYSRYFLGSGKAEELRGIARAQQADVILVDHALSPSQERSEEHTSELQSRLHLVCRLLLEKKKTNTQKLSCSATIPITVLTQSYS